MDDLTNLICKSVIHVWWILRDKLSHTTRRYQIKVILSRVSVIVLVAENMIWKGQLPFGEHYLQGNS